jgi:hypothetical protein
MLLRLHGSECVQTSPVLLALYGCHLPRRIRPCIVPYYSTHTLHCVTALYRVSYHSVPYKQAPLA